MDIPQAAVRGSSSTEAVKSQILVQQYVSGAVTTILSVKRPKFVVVQGKRNGKHVTLIFIQTENTEETRSSMKNKKSNAYFVIPMKLHITVNELKSEFIKSEDMGGEVIGTGEFRPSENHTPRISIGKTREWVTAIKREVVMSGTGVLRPPEGQTPQIEAMTDTNCSDMMAVDVSGTGSFRTSEGHTDACHVPGKIERHKLTAGKRLRVIYKPQYETQSKLINMMEKDNRTTNEHKLEMTCEHTHQPRNHST